MPFRASDDEMQGVDKCPHCGRRPYVSNLDTEMLKFACCDVGWLDTFDWNLYAVGGAGSLTDEPTPEEDEEFQRLEASQNPEPEWPLAEIGRHIERFGKLLQDPDTTIADLAGAAHDAGFNLRFDIQPGVE